MSIDVNDFLLSGGIPAARFPAIGATVRGTVIRSEVAQQTDYASGTALTWDDGSPKMQVIITLQTDERDPQIADDDGQRKLYVRGQMQAAIREALRTAGAKLEAGGLLGVQYIADKPSEKRGFNPAKQYQAQYQPPAAVAANDVLGVTPAAAGVAPESILG